ncbi:hydroxyectoine utilization dehydratase EutB [Pseudovibrio japonicus]|uniref:Hydroxyectoine utilization dehydratase EutB n=1 Tax=Pseudovibrio japonicus TaxID=366534 RepID=A0ABQ3EPT4_9HYPH|nr:pyridoxal-phosphate dependent enzyme [Pseudovibrio japonicus]GHB44114.1 hydroxyectoine utilization dehydratase EutB [Pseudovibrio japonicus]
MTIEIAHIRQAQERIFPYVQPTPLRPSHALSERLQAKVSLKFETMTATGAFKLRGATNKLLNLPEDQRARGVITVSSGNHGRAVAYISKALGIRAVVCMPEIVPPEKVAGLRDFGAEIVIHGQNQDEADAEARRIGQRDGLLFVSPFDDADVIAGQGTIGLELLEVAPQLDTVLVQLSGGGLMSGVAKALKSIKPEIEVIGISSLHGAAMLESIRAGKIVTVEEEPTIADALPGPIPPDNRYTFAMCRELVDDHIQVSEDQIAEAMAYILHNEKCIVEGAGAAGVAALLNHPDRFKGKNVAAILTGDNIKVERALSIIAKAQSPRT